MYQMKEQDKTPGKQLNEVEIGNLPEKEFRIMILKMIQDLGKRMEAKMQEKKMQEKFNKDQEELKNKHREELKNKQMNNTTIEMKDTLEGIIEAEERLSDPEDRMVECTAVEQNKQKRMKRNEDSLGDLWDNIKHTNIHILGFQKEKRERYDPRKYLKRL